MSTEHSDVFTKENLDMYLRELSREYKKLGGRNTPVELILIGGAAIIENYGFRDMTTDIDAILPAMSIMADAINRVGDRFGLPNGWLNADFIKTESYSRHFSLYSVPYLQENPLLGILPLLQGLAALPEQVDNFTEQAEKKPSEEPDLSAAFDFINSL